MQVTLLVVSQGPPCMCPCLQGMCVSGLFLHACVPACRACVCQEPLLGVSKKDKTPANLSIHVSTVPRNNRLRKMSRKTLKR